jgi:hypothetical protein
MARDFEMIQFQLGNEALKKVPNRERNQLVGCMHAHNELVVMNRLLMFSLQDVGEGELHDAAHNVQLWCIVQILIGKLFETWNMLSDRFLKANPEDPALASFDEATKKNLIWLKDYFGEAGSIKESRLRTIRDKAAFHYDKLNLDQAIDNLGDAEDRVYLAQHPVNTVYYLGSALVFRSLFASFIPEAEEADHGARVKKGVDLTLADVREANFHMAEVLYGLVAFLLDKAFGIDNLEQLRIPIKDAPKTSAIALPMFIDIGDEATVPVK